MNFLRAINRPNRVLYITYDGIFEPLGQSQVLTYLERLARVKSIYLISFEKPYDLTKKIERQELIIRMNLAGITWFPLRYHKRPSIIATAWDIAQGTVLGLWLVIKHKVTIVHARSYVPSLMALLIKRLTKVAYIFDMRGFWVDERVDGGLWLGDSLIYRLAKWFEKRFMLNADHVISLTNSAVCILKRFEYLQENMPSFTVIPTCTDLDRFKPLAVKPCMNPFVLGYVGTVGSWYMFEEIVRSFRILLRIRPDAKFLVVNRGEHHYIQKSLHTAGIPQGVAEITSCSYYEMPLMMARMHAGIFFIKPAFSKKASAPTKLGEFLGCGIPCLGNTGVGDMAEILESNRVGVAIKSFDEASLYQGLTHLLSLCAEPEVSNRCVAAAHRHFSLDEGVARYEKIYNSFER